MELTWTLLGSDSQSEIGIHPASSRHKQTEELQRSSSYKNETEIEFRLFFLAMAWDKQTEQLMEHCSRILKPSLYGAWGFVIIGDGGSELL